MPAYIIQKRIEELSKSLPEEQANIKFISTDLIQSKGLENPKLTDEKWRDAITEFAEKQNHKLIVLDNISCLIPLSDENKKEDWIPINEWLLKLRFKGIAVILNHHSGKSGTQRGTSGKEDAIDFIIKLSRPSNYNPTEGARFDIEFQKSRNIVGKNAEGFELSISENQKGELIWLANNKPSLRKEIIFALLTSGKFETQKELAEKLDIQSPYITKIKKYYTKKEYLNKEGNLTSEGKKFLENIDEKNYEDYLL